MTATQAAPFDATKLMELIETRDMLRSRIKSDEKLLAETIANIEKVCPHLMVQKRHHCSEDEYGKRTGTNYWDECTVCKKTLNYREAK